MGADATLVNAAYRASMANVPGDWSRSFDKQYEGIMAADRALTAGLGRAVAKATGGMVTAYTERRKEEGKRESTILAAQALYAQKDQLGTDALTKAAAENTYEDASDGLNPAIRNAAYTVPTDIHNNILKRSKKVFKTKKDKQYIAEQYTRLESWKRDRINDKANIKQLSDALNNGLVNTANMDPDYKVLLAQLLDNKGDFNLKGINVYNRKSDDRLMIKFTPNRLESEARYNNMMKEVDGGQPVAPIPGEVAEQAPSQVISFQDLMNGVNYKQVEQEASVVEVNVSQPDLAAERDKHSDTFKYTPEAALAKINRELSGVIKGKKVVSDLATRDILGRNTTYREELTDMVGKMDLRQFGVEDKGDPGYEDDMKDDLLREEIIGRLINPKNPSDLKFAEEEMLKYFTDLSMQGFNNKRKEIEDSQVEVEDVKGLTWAQKMAKLKYERELNKDPDALPPYKNKKVEDMVNPQTNKKFTMWSDDIIKLQDRLSTVMKSGKINQIVPVRDQMYQWSEVKGVEGQEDKGWRKVEKQPDGKFWFIDDDLNVIKKKEARIYPTMQKVLDEQGVLFQGGGTGGAGKTNVG